MIHYYVIASYFTNTEKSRKISRKAELDSREFPDLSDKKRGDPDNRR